MFRPLTVLLMLAGLLAVPVAAADAQPCWCLVWARHFEHNRAARHAYDVTWRAHGNPPGRKPVKRKLYDWQREGVFDESWCKSHPRLCKALGACLVAAGYTYGTDVAAGVPAHKATIYAAGACASAATTVMIYG
jgi:hypothetical protein